MSDGYEELAAAIVMQAYRDWCDDCKKLASGKGDVDAIKADMVSIGCEEFDEEIFTQEVIGITVLDGGDLEFRLLGGKTKIWKNLHVNDSRPEFTVTDCFQNKLFCGKCGYAYHRAVSGGKWCYWYCAAKKHKGEGRCDSTINYTDYALRCVSAFMLGLEDFDEQVFSDRIERITVEEDGSLTYRFTDGKEETWQRT